MSRPYDRALEERRWSSRAIVPALILVTMFTAMAAVGTFAYKKMRGDVLALSDGLFDALSQRIETEVRRYFEPASELVSLVASLPHGPAFRATPGELTEQVGVGIVARYPQASAFLIADDLGNFLMAQREADGAVYTRHVERTDSGGQGRWIFRDLDGRITRTSDPEHDDFDPRGRDWYQGAQSELELFWTGVYPFHRSRRPGLTVAAPIVDEVGITLGVVGVDLQLSTLSEFLAQLEVSEHGRAVIVDQAGQLIAHPVLEKVVVQDDGGTRIARIDELRDRVLERAYNRFQIESHGQRTITVDGTRYITTAASLLGSVGRDWTVLIVAPEDDFAGFLSHNFGILLLLAGSVVILGAALAMLLMIQGRKADRNARLVREGQAELDAQTNAFSELADLVAGFEVGDDVSRTKLTEIVAGAAGVSRMSMWRFEHEQILRCVDCFDSSTRGHTSGTELHRSEVEALIAAIHRGSVVAVSHAAKDERTESLHRLYLNAMGCHALLAAPLRVSDALVGVLMLEDQSDARGWTTREESFLRAVSGIIVARMRDAELAGSIQIGDASASTGSGGSDNVKAVVTSSQAPSASVEAMRTADLGEKRSKLFAKALLESRLGEGHTRAQVFPISTIAVLWLDDPLQLAGPSSNDSASNRLDGLVRSLEKLAGEADIPYLKILGDEIVFAAGFQGEPEIGARGVAKMALGVRDHCDRLLGSGGERLHFRLGIDTGPMMGSAVGCEGKAYNLWGEAARTSRYMAQSGMTGCIQVTETTYDLLRGEFLFRARGRFFLEECGETNTYILADRI